MKKSILFLFSILILLTSCKDEKIIVDPCPLDEFLALSNCDPFEPVDTISDIFKVVESMPAFLGCDSLSNSAERLACNDERVAEFVKQNLIYPQSAIENNIEGTVAASVIVNENGCLTSFRILTSVDCEIDKEALRILSTMPAWVPGKQRSVPVKVQYNIPIQFEL